MNKQATATNRRQLQIEADYVNTLRAFEASHKLWFNTTVHSEAGRLARIAKDAAMAAYMEARHEWVNARV